jgi:hypothetical protein
MRDDPGFQHAVNYLDIEDRQISCITAALETGDADIVRDAMPLASQVESREQRAARSAATNARAGRS